MKRNYYLCSCLVVSFAMLLCLSCRKDNGVSMNEPILPVSKIGIIDSCSKEFSALVLAPMKRAYPQLYSSLMCGQINVDVSYLTTEMYLQVHPQYGSLDNDTIFTVLNFDDNNGFVVYSDSYGLVALTDNGHLDIDKYVIIGTTPFDTLQAMQIYNPKDTFYNANLDQLCQSWLSSVGLECMYDPLIEVMSIIDDNAFYKLTYGDMLPVYPPYRPVDTCEYIGMRVDTLYSELYPPSVKIDLGQGTPWNSYCPVRISSKGPTPSGCGPVALCMFFSTYDYPTTVKNWTINWNGVDNDTMSRFLYEISEIAHTQHHYKGSWTLPLRMKSTMESFNRYSNVFWSRFGQYEDNVYLKYLNDGKPAILFSKDKKTGIFGSHYFVVDGLLRYTYHYTYTYSYCSQKERQVSFDLVHCNWGWYGEMNGYYKCSGGFDLKNNSPLEFINGRLKEKEGHNKDCNYSRDRRVLNYTFNK